MNGGEYIRARAAGARANEAESDRASGVRPSRMSRSMTIDQSSDGDAAMSITARRLSRITTTVARLLASRALVLLGGVESRDTTIAGVPGGGCHGLGSAAASPFHDRILGRSWRTTGAVSRPSGPA